MEYSTVNTIKCLTLLELNLDDEISIEQVRLQFRHLCLVYHPDQANKRYSDGVKFREIAEAKDYLISNMPAINESIKKGFAPEEVKEETEEEKPGKPTEKEKTQDVKRNEIKPMGLKLHNFIANVISVVQVINLSFVFLIGALGTIGCIAEGDDADAITLIAVLILSVPAFVLIVRLLKVKNEKSERYYKRVRTLYWYYLVMNAFDVIAGIGSTIQITSVFWVGFSIYVLIYYKKRKDIFVNPWNKNEVLYCRRCGKELLNGSTYCQNCGEKVI